MPRARWKLSHVARVFFPPRCKTAKFALRVWRGAEKLQLADRKDAGEKIKLSPPLLRETHELLIYSFFSKGQVI